MEVLRIFSEDHDYMGIESRDRIHQDGLWHETFHCWIVDEESVLIQKRSTTKKDFPCLFDITAAGHILATETVADGFREVEEELGIDVDSAKLVFKKVISDVISLQGFIDREFANVFFYETTIVPSEFTLQEEEVQSLYKVKRQSLIELFMNSQKKVTCYNIFDGSRMKIGLSDFVPHERNYFEEVASLLNDSTC